MNVPRQLNQWFTAFVFAIYLVIPGTIIAAPPNEIPPILQDVSDRIDALEALVRRLHGNKVAVISKSVDHSVSGRVIAAQPHLTYCIGLGDQLDQGPGAPYCWDPFNDDYVLTSPDTFREDDDGAIVTFNAETAPNFENIVTLLTNGVNDRVGYAFTYVKTNDTTTTPASTSSDRTAFSLSQVSSQIGYVDLEGFEIGNITISIDSIDLMYNSNENETSVNIRYRVVYGLAD